MPSWFRSLRGLFRGRRKRWRHALPLRLELLETRDVPSSLITEFATPTPASGLWDIALGSDGALWFTEQGPAKIGRVTTTGSMSETVLSSQFSQPQAITAGPDGALWFTDSAEKEIGRITTSGSVTSYTISGWEGSAADIVTGPDGALWFTEENGGLDALGRLTTSGSYSEDILPTWNAGPDGLVVGPDGALWFTESNANKIGRLVTTGSFPSYVTEYTIPTASSDPQGITVGPDGALWFVESATNKIGRLTTSGSFTEYTIPTANSNPVDIITGPDGALWFTESGANQIGRLTTSGVFTEYGIPTADSQPTGLAVGPDGSIWFTESNTNQVGRFMDVPPSVTGVPVNATEGNAFNGVVAAFTNADPTVTPGDFSATITWGDGNTSSGTITANGSGGFNVSGTNTYLQYGSYTTTVSVTDYLGDNATANSAATVADAPIYASGQSFSAEEGHSYSGAVATFTDGDPFATTAQFTATITWGDGNTSVGAISDNAGTFSVSGSHTYAEAGAYTVQASIQDVGGSSAAPTATATITDAPVSASGQSFSVMEGSTFNGVVATFTDGNPLATTADFAVGVIWGDGQTSVGTVSETSGTFSVTGSHTYAEAGSYPVQVSIQDVGGTNASASATATVTDAPLSASGRSFSVQEGSVYSGVIATFTDGNPLATPAYFSASIVWGDGNTGTGTITENAGVFSVSGSDTYIEAGSYTVQISIQDVGGSNASATATATVTDAPLTASGQSFTQVDGTPYTGVVATFTDGNPFATPGDFNATITWGDGHTSAGSITEVSGTFSVSGSNTYAAAGSYPVQIQIDDIDGSTASAAGTATVTDAAISASGQPFTVQDGSAFSGVVTTFTDGNPLANSGDFTATITWGDGQSTSGAVSENSGTFSVTGTHTYAEAGSYSVQVSILSIGGSSASPTATATVTDAPISASGQPFSVMEGSSFNGVVATFTDGNPLATPADFTATITWGDGQTSGGAISENSGTFSVTGSHTYVEAGSYTVQISIQSVGGSSASASALATITDAPLSATGQSFTEVDGTAYTGAVATFTDGNPFATPGDFSATITWGDGHTSAGTVSENSGTFTVSGSNTYAAAGSYTVQVQIDDIGGSTASATTTATITDAAISASGQPFTVQDGSAFTGVVATFTDGNPLATTGDFTATITWGDGQTSAGAISENSGTYSVMGTHTYAEAGSYPVQVSILSIGGSSASPTTTATVTDAPLTAGGQPFSVMEGSAFNGVVATFTDGNPLATTADLTATITWGDGQTSIASISENSGTFSVTGSHTYVEAGSYTVQIAIQSVGGSSASASATATITDAPLSATGQSFTEVDGTPYTGAVATFTDGNPFATPANFSATITWGDGHTSAGSITENSGTFTVSGSNTYAAAGAYPVQIAIDDVDGSTASATAIATITDAAISAAGQPFTVQEGSAFSGVVATFTDANPLASSGEFTATITWGDGQSTSGAVSENSGTFSVTGMHTYAEAGSYSVQVSILAVGGSSASPTTTATVTDAPLSASGQPFSVMEGSAFNRVVATFTDGNPLATPADFTATITWGDGQTNVGSVSENAGMFSVTGSHTYAEAGSYTVQVSIQDVGGSTASASAPATITDAPLSATGQPFTEVDGTAYAGAVATFTDGNPLATSADFIATITWGDGYTSTGTISENSGTFTVSGSNTYAAAGRYTVQVQIDDIGGVSASATATATITDAAISAAGQSFTVQEGTAFSGVVATFTDGNPLASSADFTATIHWGDGQTTAGTVSEGSGTFRVTGTYTYAEAASYTVQVSIEHVGGANASAGATAAVSDAPLSASGHSFSAVAGSTYAGAVATFTDGNPLATPADFTATISWGDGHTSAGVITEQAGTFTVSGTNAYVQSGSYSVQVTIHDKTGSAASARGTATIADAPVSAAGQSFSAVEGSSFSGVVATFTDGNPFASASDFSASITWGDGNTAVGTVAQTGDTFVVAGSDTYTDAGSYTVLVQIRDSGGASATASATADITDAPLTATGQPVSAVAGNPFAGTVATFTDGNPFATSADFTATISWGDGQTTAGTISDGSGGFTVSSGHTYASAISGVGNVTIVDVDGASVTTGFSVAVSQPTFQGEGATLDVSTAVSFTTTVATFVPIVSSSAGDYRAEISWGDGTTSTGTVVEETSGILDIVGSHTYATSGTDAVTVTLSGANGVLATAAGSANITSAGSLMGKAGTVSATNAIPYSGMVASFSDSNPAATVSDYTATVQWGDGQTSPGIIVPDGSGHYDVISSFVYFAPGSFTVTVSVQDDLGERVTVIGTAHVAQFEKIPPTVPPHIATLVTAHASVATPVAASAAAVTTVTASATQAYSFPIQVNVDDGSAASADAPSNPRIPPPRASAKPSSAAAAAARQPAASAAAKAPVAAAAGHGLLVNSKLMFAELDAMSHGIDARTLNVQDIACGFGLVASAGYVVWALRNSYLFTSLLAATPLWRQFDPLAVMDLWEKNRPKWFAADDDDEEESLESLIERNERLPAVADHERTSP